MGTIKVELPVIMRQDAEGRSEIEVSAENVQSALKALTSKYPLLERRILDNNGDPHPFVGIYLEDEDIRFMKGLQTPLGEGDRVLLTSAVAGG